MTGAPATQRSANKRGEGSQLRSEILAAAARLLARNRSRDAVTLRAIAREAGIAAPSIYGHFADRDAILDEVVADTFVALAAACRLAAGGAASGEDEARAICGAYLSFAKSNAGQYSILFERSEANIAEPPHAYPEGLEAFAMLERAMVRAAAEMGREATDPGRDAQCVWAGLHGLATLTPSTPGFPWRSETDLAGHLVSVVLLTLPLRATATGARTGRRGARSSPATPRARGTSQTRA